MLTIQTIESHLADFDYGLGELSRNMRNGMHRSLYRGSGFNFTRIAPYEQDPDARRIDWDATLKDMDLRVRQFVEEKDIAVLEIDDLSGSVHFGTALTKVERIAMIRAAFAFSAAKHRDRYGAIGVTDKIEPSVTFPLGAYKDYYRTVAEATLAFKTTKPGGGLVEVQNLLPSTPSLIVLVSDFFDSAEYYARVLRRLHGHEIVGIALRDLRETVFPATKGIVRVRDIESGKERAVWFNKKRITELKNKAEENHGALTDLFRERGHDLIWLPGDGNDLELIINHFTGKEG